MTKAFPGTNQRLTQVSKVLTTQVLAFAAGEPVPDLFARMAFGSGAACAAERAGTGGRSERRKTRDARTHGWVEEGTERKEEWSRVLRKRATPRHRFCGAPRWVPPESTTAHAQTSRGYIASWKAQCGETRLLRVEGGEERTLLFILTLSESCRRSCPLRDAPTIFRETIQMPGPRFQTDVSGAHLSNLCILSSASKDCKTSGLLAMIK